MLRILLLLQSAVAADIPFDLAKVGQQDGQCRPGGGGSEIVVCGRRSDSGERLTDIRPTVEQGLPKAEFMLFGGVRGKIDAQQGYVGGFPSKRLMVTVTVPF